MQVAQLKVQVGKIVDALASGLSGFLDETDASITSKVREVFRNSIFSISTQSISVIINFIIGVLIARYLGAKALGQYAIGASLSGLVFGIANFGIQGILTREVSKNAIKAKEYLGNALGIRSIITLPLGLVATWTIAILLGFKGDTLTVILLLALFTWVSSIVGLFYGVFQAAGKFEYQFVFTAFYKVASLLGCFWVLKSGKNIIYIIILFITLQGLTCIFSGIKVYQSICPINVKLDIVFWKDFLRESFPLALGGIAEFINLKSDALLLGAFKGENPTGIYNASYNLYLGVVFFPYAVVVAFFPSVSDAFASSKESALKLFRTFFILLGALSCLLSFVFVYFSNKIVSLVYGGKFVSSAKVLTILALGLPFIVLNRLCSRTLTAFNLQEWMFYIVSIGAIFNIVGNIIFIPKYSYIGASTTTVLTEALVLCLQMWKLYQAGFAAF